MPLLNKESTISSRIKFNPLRKAQVKHEWYIKNKRNGDNTPKPLGRPFFSKTTEKPKKTKISCIERKRKAIENNLKKIQEKADAFRRKLMEERGSL